MQFIFDSQEPVTGVARFRSFLPAGQQAPILAPHEAFQFGIEEEYFLSDAETFEVSAKTPDAHFQTADFGMPGHIGREFYRLRSKSRPSGFSAQMTAGANCGS